MDKKSQKAIEPAEFKKQLEFVSGQKLDVTAEQIRNFRYPVGAHDYTDGTVLWRSFILPGQNCIASPLLDASGGTTTDGGGQLTFLLSNAICLPQLRSLAEPVNLVATAQLSSPFFVTTTHQMIADPNNPQGFNDVQITVYTWDANGAPAPEVPIHWRCRLVSYQIIV